MNRVTNKNFQVSNSADSNPCSSHIYFSLFHNLPKAYAGCHTTVPLNSYLKLGSISFDHWVTDTKLCSTPESPSKFYDQVSVLS